MKFYSVCVGLSFRYVQTVSLQLLWLSIQLVAYKILLLYSQWQLHPDHVISLPLRGLTMIVQTMLLKNQKLIIELNSTGRQFRIAGTFFSQPISTNFDTER